MNEEDGDRPKIGRPTRHQGERLSKSRTFRIRAEIDAGLVQAAQDAGRSVSEEIERRLSHYPEMQMDIELMRRVIANHQQGVESLRKHHETIEKDLREEVSALIAELNELIRKDNNKTFEEFESELDAFGYKKLHLDDGEFVWAHPDADIAIEMTRLEASLLADRLEPLLRSALLSAAVETFKEGKK